METLRVTLFEETQHSFLEELNLRGIKYSHHRLPLQWQAVFRSKSLLVMAFGMRLRLLAQPGLMLEKSEKSML